MNRPDDSTLIGKQVHPEIIGLTTTDGRQYLVRDGRVVQEIVPGNPLWREDMRIAGLEHWTHWARGLRG